MILCDPTCNWRKSIKISSGECEQNLIWIFCTKFFFQKKKHNHQSNSISIINCWIYSKRKRDSLKSDHQKLKSTKKEEKKSYFEKLRPITVWVSLHKIHVIWNVVKIVFWCNHCWLPMLFGKEKYEWNASLNLDHYYKMKTEKRKIVENCFQYSYSINKYFFQGIFRAFDLSTPKIN